MARIALCGGLPVVLHAQTNNASSSTVAAAAAAVQMEVNLIAAAHLAAKSDDASTTDAQLAGAGLGEFATKPASVLLARRAAAVCGWLQNENDYGRAITLANRVTQQLASLSESTDADHEERLYWEAWLRGRALDQKVTAVALLQAAEKLKPDDVRVLDLEWPLVAAINAFGH